MSCHWTKNSHTTCWLPVNILFICIWMKSVSNKILGARNQKLLDIFVAFDCLSIWFFSLLFFSPCIYLTSFFLFAHIHKCTHNTRWSNESEENNQQKQLNAINKWENIGNLLHISGAMHRMNWCFYTLTHTHTHWLTISFRKKITKTERKQLK